jgi:enoyl-CoA hydratase
VGEPEPVDHGARRVSIELQPSVRAMIDGLGLAHGLGLGTEGEEALPAHVPTPPRYPPRPMEDTLMPNRLVAYRVERGVATLTLTNPPVNAYSHEMMRDLDEAVLRARFDPAVHVLVLTGAGEKVFCAGADIEMLSKADPTFKYYFCLHANETLCRLEQTPKLVIAALNGSTVGGGLEVALAADVRVARRGPAKVGLPEVNLGVLPGTGGTQRLARVVGRSTAIKMMVEGTLFDLDTALAHKLVDEVWDAEGFAARVQTYAEGFCPPGRASLAVGRIKRAVQSGAEMALEHGLALERELQAELFASQDAREGIAAYVARRKAEFGAK